MKTAQVRLKIFAGAMKDYNEDGYIDATLVGKKDLWKRNCTELIYNLSDGDAVKITTSKYYTQTVTISTKRVST